MANEETPKEETFDSKIDAAFASVEKEQAALPETGNQNEQKPVSPDGVSDTQKTLNKDKTGFEGVDGGFMNHPAWKEREALFKQTKTQMEKMQRDLEKASALLGDPAKLAEMLESKGFKINKADETDMLSAIAKKKGWNIESLSSDQKAYIRDIIDLAEATTDAKMSVFEKQFSEKLTPYQQVLDQQKRVSEVQKDFSNSQKLAKEYGFDFDKEIKPHMDKALDNLGDEEQFNATEFVKDLLIKLMFEKNNLQVRQDGRDQKKAVMKGLTPSVSSPQAKDSKPFPSATRNRKAFDEQLDELMDSVGVKD